MTITEFLLARIAEDEARVERDLHPSGPHPDLGSVLCEWEESRWLAECKAKRRIVAEHAPEYGSCSVCCDDWGNAMTGDSAQPVESPCPTLWVLATIYADHPDFARARRD